MNSYGDAIQVVRAQLVDGYGGQRVRDWAGATTADPAPASVQTVKIVETETGREVVTTDKKVFTATDVLVTDRVLWRGTTYNVTGVDPVYQSGRLDHLEVTMEVHEEPAA